VPVKIQTAQGNGCREGRLYRALTTASCIHPKHLPNLVGVYDIGAEAGLILHINFQFTLK